MIAHSHSLRSMTIFQAHAYIVLDPKGLGEAGVARGQKRCPPLLTLAAAEVQKQKSSRVSPALAAAAADRSLPDLAPLQH